MEILKLTNPKHYENIGASLRKKLRSETQFKPGEMSAAIDSIPEWVNMATGTFTPTAGANQDYSSETLRDAPISISGLGFTPARVVVFTIDGGVTLYGTGESALLSIDSSSRKALHAYSDDTDGDGYYDYATLEAITSDISGTYNTTPYRMTFDADGFTLTKSSARLAKAVYYWIAMG